MKRGTYSFEVNTNGDLLDMDVNINRLRRLWLDRTMISANDLGPGDAGDFDYGAWHVGCHLVAAGGVRQAPNGQMLWLEISHSGSSDEYFASVTVEVSGNVQTYPIGSQEGQRLLQDSTLLGFIEGNSVGHISAHGIRDDEKMFNGCPRQEFDRPTTDKTSDGGKVWEHWCTLRDIRQTARVGTSVLRAYVALTAALGDRFAPTVARGRREYKHPKQLCALIKAGFTSLDAATWSTTPFEIPPQAELLLLEAKSSSSLAAAKILPWAGPPRYYMFKRRISNWNSAEAVIKAWREFSPTDV